MYTEHHVNDADTVEGALRHETLGERPEALAPADAGAHERVHARSVSLSSERHGLTAVIDLVEGEGHRVTPVDYQHGAPRDQDGTLEAWPTDRVQVCVQAVILEAVPCAAYARRRTGCQRAIRPPRSESSPA